MSEWEKARDRLKKRKCDRGPRCEACRDYRAFVVASDFTATYWLMDDMWMRLHEQEVLKKVSL